MYQTGTTFSRDDGRGSTVSVRHVASELHFQFAVTHHIQYAPHDAGPHKNQAWLQGGFCLSVGFLVQKEFTVHPANHTSTRQASSSLIHMPPPPGFYIYTANLIAPLIDLLSAWLAPN
jgi:hypothetical protein